MCVFVCACVCVHMSVCVCVCVRVCVHVLHSKNHTLLAETQIHGGKLWSSPRVHANYSCKLENTIFR